ncbi:MAG: methyltransferase [Flavobacteriales bacterium]
MLDKTFWDSRYINKKTGWDIGYPSTPLTNFIDTLNNKQLSILIPGCGRAYEAEYLFNKGFDNLTLIDISPTALNEFSKRLPTFPKDKIVVSDFFKHQGQYDLILEQTFFCAIDQKLRSSYVSHCHDLLKENGRIVGLLFAEEFGNDHPPFGGTKDEYQGLFYEYFDIEKMEISKASIQARQDRELFISFKKKKL